MFKNVVLRNLFWPKGNKVTGEWKRLHDEELYDLFSSPNIIQVTKRRRMKWMGHVVRMGDGRDAYKVLVRRPYGKRPCGRLTCRWE